MSLLQFDDMADFIERTRDKAQLKQVRMYLRVCASATL